jgi:GDP-mannose 6-dehydrogenase
MAMKVTVFGLGYVGCVTAACLAKAGHKVVGVDLSQEKVDMINAGRAPIVEAGLGELLAEVVGAGLLSATTDGTGAVRDSEIALICVGTPGLGYGRPDVNAIDRVGHQIGVALEGRERTFTVVLRSTVLPGTTERVLYPAIMNGSKGTARVKMAMNPEFMREGTSLHDFEFPPMIVVGCDDLGTASLVRDLYSGVKAPFVETAIRTAELVKYSCNAYHALKVTFANEMGTLCDALGADGREVMRIFAIDTKLNISAAYLRPGFAFGGSCLPKDVRALNWAAKDREVDVPLLAAIMPSNESQIRSAVDTVLKTGKRRISVAGLAFKPGTDDLRESPVVTLVEQLIGKGRDVRILDKNVSFAKLMGANRSYIEAEIPHVATLLCDDVETLVEHADVLVIGSANADAVTALGLIGPDCEVIDLTRGAVYDGQRQQGAARPVEAAGVKRQ